MTKKKESWIKHFLITIGGLGRFLLLVAMFMFLILFLRLYHNSTSYICSHNPEKCVCEEYGFVQGDYQKHVSFQNGFNECITANNGQYLCRRCNNYHLKTQSELDIDDCNNNPRKDDKCKCEEEKLNQEGLQKCKEFTRQTNHSCFVLNECIKSHPKTECEKGNTNWVEETETYWEGQQGEKYNLCVQGVNNSPSKFYRETGINPLWAENCSYFEKHETICREKNAKTQ